MHLTALRAAGDAEHVRRPWKRLVMQDSVKSFEALERAIEGASWFQNLGSFRSHGFGIGVSPPTWRALSAQSLDAELGLSATDSESEIPDFSEWLPTSIHQPDPVSGKALAKLETEAESAAYVRKLRLDIARLAARSLRNMHGHELLSVGAVNYKEAARAAAGFACRSAATEIALNSPGFWATLIPIYNSGHWPFAITTGGEVLVL